MKKFVLLELLPEATDIYLHFKTETFSIFFVFALSQTSK